MRARLLPLAAVLSACAAPEPGVQGSGAPGGFDARAWLATAEAALDSTAWRLDYEATAARSRALADTLDAAVGWKRACADAFGDSTFFAEERSGILMIHPLGPDEALVEATCYFGAYQGSSALVRVAGGRAALLPVPGLDSTGALRAHAPVIGGFLDVAAPARRLEVFTKYRGPGDCGMLARYRLTAAGRVEAEEIREQADCDGPNTTCDGEPCVDPAQWPVVYPR